jgi:hypothetical protein
VERRSSGTRSGTRHPERRQRRPSRGSWRRRCRCRCPAKKPVSAGSAPEPERQPTKEEEARDAAVKEELIAALLFLGDGIVGGDRQVERGESAIGSRDKRLVQESGERSPMVASSVQQEEVKVTTIPGAVDASPVADLSWREKKGYLVLADPLRLGRFDSCRTGGRRRRRSSRSRSSGSRYSRRRSR